VITCDAHGEVASIPCPACMADELQRRAIAADARALRAEAALVTQRSEQYAEIDCLHALIREVLESPVMTDALVERLKAEVTQ
jgi:hypothetical protein